MNDALCTVLCENSPWEFCDFDNKRIAFNSDGTGEVYIVHIQSTKQMLRII